MNILDKMRRDLERRREIRNESNSIFDKKEKIWDKVREDRSIISATDRMNVVNSDPEFQELRKRTKELDKESLDILKSYPEMKNIWADVDYESNDFEDFLTFGIRVIETYLRENEP